MRKKHTICFALLFLVFITCYSSYAIESASYPPADNITSAKGLAEKAYKHLTGNTFSYRAREEAREILAQAKKIDAEEAEIYLVEAAMRLMEGYKIGPWYRSDSFVPGTTDYALEKARYALNLNSNYSKTYSILAWLHIIKTEYKKAEDYLEMAYKRDDNSYYYWLYLGTLEMEKKNYDQARECYNIAHSLADSDEFRNIVRYRKQHLALLTGNKYEARSIYLDQIRRYPDSPHVYGNYAAFLLYNNEPDKAIEYYQKALDISPYPAARKGLALAKKRHAETLK